MAKKIEEEIVQRSEQEFYYCIPPFNGKTVLVRRVYYLGMNSHG